MEHFLLDDLWVRILVEVEGGVKDGILTHSEHGPVTVTVSSAVPGLPQVQQRISEPAQTFQAFDTVASSHSRVSS